MKRLFFIGFTSILSSFSLIAQDSEPDLKDCGDWLEHYTNYQGNQNNKTYLHSKYEMNDYDPNLAKFSYITENKRSKWVEEYSFKWSNLESIEVSNDIGKKPTKYLVKVKFLSKNNSDLITKKHIASGNAIVGKNVMNGFVTNNFLWIRMTVASFDDQASAIETANRFRKIFQRILNLNGTGIGVNEDFFREGK